MPRRWGRCNEKKEEEFDPQASELTAADTKSSASQPAVKYGYPENKLNELASGRPAKKLNELAPGPLSYYERGQTYDVHVGLKDTLPQPGIPAAAAAYRLKLRALWLRGKGISQAEAALRLGCPTGSLADAWRAPLKEIPRPPREVAKYIGAYETRMLDIGVEPFRAPTLKRGYAEGCAGVYEELASALKWKQAVLRKRNYETGDVTITSIASSRQDCCFPTMHTGLPHVDAILAKIRSDFDIQDPGAYLMCNWYLDGNTNIASHQHDFWSATLSFGASRIFLLDGQPVLLGDGDLLVFGTQRHSVPKMPAVKEGRISISVFWYPERTTADRTFTITMDPSMAAAALSGDASAEAIARAVASNISRMPLNIEGRGVGKYENDDAMAMDYSDDDDDGYYHDEGDDNGGFLSEERLIAIALEVSKMEQ